MSLLVKRLLINPRLLCVMKMPEHVSVAICSRHPKLSLLSHNNQIRQHAEQNAVPRAEHQVSGLMRTHRCGEVDLPLVGSVVKLAGWLEYKRGKQFFTLRDTSGNCQMVNNLDISLPTKESIVYVEGKVQARPEKDINPDMKTGHIEVVCSDIRILNKCKHLPFPINEYSPSREEMRMRYRYIDLRSKIMQHNLKLRSSFLLKVRKFLCEEKNFVDVETPTLFRKTPGGAQEFVVPTQNPGLFYSLPQSPQQFKQLLMAGAIDRYMQIAKCYRDEGAKPDRQPEFTQLDLELSFTSQEEIKSLIEDMFIACWPAELPPLAAPFQRMSHYDAMLKYGVDKPDTRYESTIEDITNELVNITVFRNELSNTQPAIKAINIPNGCNRLKAKQIKEIKEMVEKQYSLNVAVVKIGEGGVWNSPLSKFIHQDNAKLKVNEILGANPNDLMLICGHESWKLCCEALGKCRTLASSVAALNGQPLYQPDEFNFLWVEDFPLFELEEGVLHSAHHPFTAPLDEDFELMISDPSKVRGQHYDLVLNGSEIGGGSIRIHDSATQRYVMETILRENSSQLEHLLQALDSGCPPHGGIALGLDRLLAIMCGSPSIRDVIAFPKSSEGSDLTTGAPCELDQADLDLYNISVKC